MDSEYVYVYLCVSACMCVCTCACVYMRVCACVCVCIFLYIEVISQSQESFPIVLCLVFLRQGLALSVVCPLSRLTGQHTPGMFVYAALGL